MNFHFEAAREAATATAKPKIQEHSCFVLDQALGAFCSMRFGYTENFS